MIKIGDIFHTINGKLIVNWKVIWVGKKIMVLCNMKNDLGEISTDLQYHSNFHEGEHSNPS